MKINGSVISMTAAIVAVLSGSFADLKEIQHPRTIDSADSSVFIPNSAAGWTMYSHYLDQDTPDTVRFEVLIGHSRNIDWSIDQLIGYINSRSFTPKNHQDVTYYLLSDNVWNVRVTTKGQCFLKMLKGTVPPGDPVVIPVYIKYKNN